MSDAFLGYFAVNSMLTVILLLFDAFSCKNKQINAFARTTCKENY